MRHLCRRERRRAVFAAARLLSAVLLLVLAARGAQNDPLAESQRALYGGDPKQAALLADNFLKANPESADARVALAQARMAVGDFDAAYTQLSEAIRLDPRNVEALYHFSKLCAILSQVEHQRLFAMAPDNYRVHQLMAEAYVAQQNLDKAEEAYQAALKANPKSVTVLAALGDLKRGQLGSASEVDLDAAVPSRYAAAITYYARAVEIDPASYEANYGLGVCYLNMQKGPQAVEHFRKALSVEPKSAVAHLALGRALLSAEDTVDAVDELNIAVKLDPRMRQAYFLLGRAYQKLGKADLAQQVLAKERELRQAEFAASQQAISTGGLPAKKPAVKEEQP